MYKSIFKSKRNFSFNSYLITSSKEYNNNKKDNLWINVDKKIVRLNKLLKIENV